MLDEFLCAYDYKHIMLSRNKRTLIYLRLFHSFNRAFKAIQPDKKEGNISHVPSIFVNGFPLPGVYSLDDIRCHISELVDKEHKPTEN